MATLNATPARSYAEVMGVSLFSWRNVLEEARSNGLSETACLCWASRATSWVTCGVGLQSSLLPRDEDGIPLDEGLQNLGTRFCRAVFNAHYDVALDRLTDIEERAAYLLTLPTYTDVST